jgi:hypothetical protein
MYGKVIAALAAILLASTGLVSAKMECIYVRYDPRDSGCNEDWLVPGDGSPFCYDNGIYWQRRN